MLLMALTVVVVDTLVYTIRYRQIQISLGNFRLHMRSSLPTYSPRPKTKHPKVGQSTEVLLWTSEEMLGNMEVRTNPHWNFFF